MNKLMDKLTIKQKGLLLMFLGCELIGALMGFGALHVLWSPWPMAGTALFFGAVWALIEGGMVLSEHYWGNNKH